MSALSWILLGVLGAWIAEQPLPADHITTVVEGACLDFHNPLKWQGRLRDEPQNLPWGMALKSNSAEWSSKTRGPPTHGGLRLSLVLIRTTHLCQICMPETK